MGQQQIRAVDLQDPSLFALNNSLGFLYSKLEPMYTPGQQVNLGASLIVPGMKQSGANGIPTDPTAYLTLGAAQQLFSPANIRSALVFGSYPQTQTVVQPIPTPGVPSVSSSGVILEASDFCGGAGLSQICINNAIAALPANGGAIHVKAGTWTISGPVSVNKPNVILFGDGNGTNLQLSGTLGLGFGMIDITSPGCSLQTMQINGNTTSPQLLLYNTTGSAGFKRTDPQSGTLKDTPIADTLTRNSGVWVHGGSDNFSSYQVTYTKMTGYSIFLDATLSSILYVLIDSCNFIANHACKFGTSALDIAYGSWGGGILYEGGTYFPSSGGSGTQSFVQYLTISDNTFSDCYGNCFWGHSPQLTILHDTITVTGNKFNDIGLDCINIGASQNVTVKGNSGYRVGYLDGDPKFLQNLNATFLDTSGYVRSASYIGNTALNCNGGVIDTDGLTDSVVSGNTGTIVDPTDPLYGPDQIANYGYGGLGNVSKGINTNNSYDIRGQKGNSYCGNVFRNMGVNAITLFNTRNTLCANNTIYHPPTAYGVPMNLANSSFTGTVNTSGTTVTWVSGDQFDPALVDAGYLFIFINGTQYQISSVTDATHLVLTTSAGTQSGVSLFIGKSQNNTVTGNQIFYDAANFCIYEDPSIQPMRDPNYIFNNNPVGGNLGEVLLSSSTGNKSVSRLSLSTNDSSANQRSSMHIKREGFTAQAVTKLYKSVTAGDTQVWQAGDVGPVFNVGYGGGTCNTSGTAVTRVTGPPFLDFGGATNAKIQINGVVYQISSISTDNSLTLTGSAGTQTGVIYYPLMGGFTTASRTTLGFYDTVATGHGYFDGFLAMTDTTFIYPNDVAADYLTTNAYGLLRYNSSSHAFEQSVTVSGGHRVWTPVGSGSGSVAGSDTQVQYNKGGAFGADAYLKWDYTNHVFSIASVVGTAGLTVNGGTGTVNTSGAAVTWVSGVQFNPSLAGTLISINSVIYTVLSYGSPTTLTLTTSAGTQTGVAFGLTGGYIQSDQGFYATSGIATSWQTVNIPTGGVFARSVVAAKYTQVGQSSGVPTQTTGDTVPSNGNIYYDTGLNQLRGYINGSWTNLGAAGGIGGSNTDIQYNNIGSLGGSNNFIWNNSSQLMTVTGIAATAGIAVSNAWVQADGGFQSSSTSLTAINVPGGYGLVKGISALDTAYNSIQTVGGFLGKNASIITGTPGATFPVVAWAATGTTPLFRIEGPVVSGGKVWYMAANANWVNGSSSWIADTSGAPSTYAAVAADTNNFAVYVSAGGSSTITFTQALTVNQSGNVGILINPTTTAGQALQIGGVIGVAGIALTNGYAQVDGGYLTSSSSSNAFNAPNGFGSAKGWAASSTQYDSIQTVGGVKARSVLATTYMNVGSSATVPTATTGDTVPLNGDIYYDTGLTQLRAYVAGSWVSLGSGSGTPSGPNMAVQYNNSGLFGGSANFLWDQANQRVSYGGTITATAFDHVSYKFDDCTQAVQATNSTRYSGMNMYDHTGSIAASFQYGNPSSGVPDTFFFGTRNGTGKVQIWTNSANRMQVDAAGLISIGSSIFLNQSGAISISGVLTASGASAGVNVLGNGSSLSIQTQGGVTATFGFVQQSGGGFYSQSNGSSPSTPGGGYAAFAHKTGSQWWYYNPATPGWALVDFAAAGGSISINGNSGSAFTLVQGSANRVLVNTVGTATTFSLPQDIDTGASVTFGLVTSSGGSGTAFSLNTGTAWSVRNTGIMLTTGIIMAGFGTPTFLDSSRNIRINSVLNTGGGTLINTSGQFVGPGVNVGTTSGVAGRAFNPYDSFGTPYTGQDFTLGFNPGTGKLTRNGVDINTVQYYGGSLATWT